MLTTFGTLAQELPHKDKQTAKLKKQGTERAPIEILDDSEDEQAAKAEALAAAGPQGKGKRKAFGAEGGPLYQVTWHR